MARALRTETEFNGHEIVIERPDGQRRTVMAHANPIRDGSGKVLGAVNVLVDITEHKHAEDALKTADRSKNEFLAILAHELRNPLAPIRNAVQILNREGTLAPESQWALSAIERQVRQLARLIDDLVDVARITSNRLELRTERVDLASVLRSAIETSQSHLKAGGQEFTVVLPETGRQGAAAVAEKLRAAIAAEPFRPGFPVTVSVGVACRPEDGVTPDQLIQAADVALYEAKRAGRDRVVTAAR